ISFLLAAIMVTLLLATVTSSYFGWRANQQAHAVTDTLYDALLQEIRLTREGRKQGYGEKVRQLVDKARRRSSTHVDPDELRPELVLTMGDFVADMPTVIRPVDGEVTALRLSSDGSHVFAGVHKSNTSVLRRFDSTTGKTTAEIDVPYHRIDAIALRA